MVRTHIAQLVDCAIRKLVHSGSIPAAEYPPAEVLDPRNPEHGDYSCNLALIGSKQAGMQPRELAGLLAAALAEEEDFASVEVAGPGFLNFRLTPRAMSGFLYVVLKEGVSFYKAKRENLEKINVEFVSVNPNGPITVGSGRGAAFGDTLCRILSAAGHEVAREYYINDGVNSEQMRLFAESVMHYYRQRLGLPTEFPVEGYKGEYVEDVAQAIYQEHAQSAGEKGVAWFQRESEQLMMERQKEDLARFGVRFDVWFSEQSLHDSGAVKETLNELQKRGVAYEKEGALWLKSTEYGDDKDRVLVRDDGRPTYIASDIAYHRNKFNRGFDKVIDVLGPDHHGYIGRLNASVASSGFSLDRFQVVIFQIVRFVKDGKPAPMRKRDGNIYELRDLMNEIGPDVTRFFYLMRSHETHMDFDIDLATKQSDENPVYYVQYAHARICSVLKKAEEAGFKTPEDAAPYLHKLSHPKEMQLIRKLCDLPHEAARCAVDYGVHRLTAYAVDLARTYHLFYDSCRVIQPEDAEITYARLALCEGARIALRGVFDLLGISAPERMERAEQLQS